MNACGQLDMFPAYPEIPGARRRDTSQQAAEAVAEKAPTLQARCLGALRDADDIGGLTADEVAARLGLHVLTIRPRITELNKLMKIRDTGRRRRNTSGKRAIVWRVAR